MGTRMIDWSRMARPQDDGYDTAITEQLATERFGFIKVMPEIGTPATMEGRVALVHYPQKPAEWLHNASFDNPIIEEASKALKEVWPAAYAMTQALCTELWILKDVNHPDTGMTGCTCGNTPNFGGICATTQGVIGLMHAFVHEVCGHWKLKAMGVDLMTWDGPLVTNDPEDRYVSPVRKDMTRPMGAVLHAQYSYLHVLEMEIRAIKAGMTADMLELNVARMAEGRATLQAWRQHEEGKPFALAMDQWTEELLDEGRSLLKG